MTATHTRTGAKTKALTEAGTQGFAASIAGIIVYRAAFFGGFDTLKSVALQFGFGAAVWQAFIVAEITTTVAGLISYPFDTVRRRAGLRTQTASAPRT